MRDQILEDLKQAMKAQAKEKLAVIRMVKGAIQMEELNTKRPLTDDEVIGIIAKQIKTRKESIVEFEKGKREDLIKQTEQEIEILNHYMPEPLTEEEVDQLIQQAIQEVNPSGIKEMGKVLSVLSPKVKGRYDMSSVSSKVKSILS